MGLTLSYQIENDAPRIECLAFDVNAIFSTYVEEGVSPRRSSWTSQRQLERGCHLTSAFPVYAAATSLQKDIYRLKQEASDDGALSQRAANRG